MDNFSDIYGTYYSMYETEKSDAKCISLLLHEIEDVDEFKEKHQNNIENLFVHNLDKPVDVIRKIIQDYCDDNMELSAQVIME